MFTNTTTPEAAISPVQPVQTTPQPGKVAFMFTRTRTVIETSFHTVEVPGEIRELLQTNPTALQAWAEQHIIPNVEDWQTRNVSSSLNFSASEAR